MNLFGCTPVAAGSARLTFCAGSSLPGRVFFCFFWWCSLQYMVFVQQDFTQASQRERRYLTMSGKLQTRQAQVLVFLCGSSCTRNIWKLQKWRKAWKRSIFRFFCHEKKQCAMATSLPVSEINMSFCGVEVLTLARGKSLQVEFWLFPKQLIARHCGGKAEQVFLEPRPIWSARRKLVIPPLEG